MSGLRDPNKLDLITRDSASGEYALIMVEDRPWTDSPEQMSQLSDKINNYAVFVLDEGLTRAHPESVGAPVRIQLDCVDAPSPKALTLINTAARRLEEYRIRLVVNILPKSSS